MRRGLRFEPSGDGASVGWLKVPEREGILRAIDGQHRLLAMHADIDRFRRRAVHVRLSSSTPAEDHVVQMFVTITRSIPG